MNRIFRNLSGNLAGPYLEKSNYCRHGYYYAMCDICAAEHKRFENEANKMINESKEENDDLYGR